MIEVIEKVDPYRITFEVRTLDPAVYPLKDVREIVMDKIMKYSDIELLSLQVERTQPNWDVNMDVITDEEIAEAIRYNSSRSGSLNYYTDMQIAKAMKDRSLVRVYYERATKKIRAYIKSE